MLNFLYQTVPGRACLRVLSNKYVSQAAGHMLSSSISRVMIRPFVSRHDIDLTEYVYREYSNFNEFFSRRIRRENRPIDARPDELISPCDGLISAYRIEESSTFEIKGSRYDVNSLLGGADFSDIFKNGICLVFRLCVANYHRYHYIDNGTKEDNVFIPGILHTVRPIALEHTNVYIQNSREYTLMHTEHFGDVAQIEVGALLVGRIENYDGAGEMTRGDEKGMFLYGGSTVVLLFEEGKVDLSDKYFTDTLNGIETPVRMGQKL